MRVENVHNVATALNVYLHIFQEKGNKIKNFN